MPKNKPSARRPGVRADARIDRPEGLTAAERQAYVVGYGKGCTKWAKRHSGPTADLRPDGTPDPDALREANITYEWERHPSCHRAGLKELERHRERAAQVSA